MRVRAGLVLALVAGTAPACAALDFRPLEALRTIAGTTWTADLESAASVRDAMDGFSEDPGSGGNAVDLLVNGDQAFPRMLEDIRAARERVSVETYILEPDATGRAFLGALEEAARRGVEVRLLADDFGSRALRDAHVRPLREAGGEVRIFNPLLHWTVLRAGNRDHRKVLVVDGRVAYMGGLNLGDAYAGDGFTGYRDTALRVEGPAALDAERVFARTWEEGGGGWLGKDLPIPGTTPLKRLLDAPFLALGFGAAPFRPAAPRDGGPGERPGGGALVWALENSPQFLSSPILESYLVAVASARERVYVTNAYLVPPHRLARALVRAARRGVDVRILVPHAPDEPLVGPLARNSLGVLLRNGVRVYRWDGPLHAKTAVVDATWTTIGSCNLNYRGCFLNYEANFAVFDRALAARMAEQFLRDLENAREVSLEEWEGRPLRHVLEEMACALFRGQS